MGSKNPFEGQFQGLPEQNPFKLKDAKYQKLMFDWIRFNHYVRGMKVVHYSFNSDNKGIAKAIHASAFTLSETIKKHEKGFFSGALDPEVVWKWVSDSMDADDVAAIVFKPEEQVATLCKIALNFAWFVHEESRNDELSRKGFGQPFVNAVTTMIVIGDELGSQLTRTFAERILEWMRSLRDTSIKSVGEALLVPIWMVNAAREPMLHSSLNENVRSLGMCMGDSLKILQRK